MYYLWPGRSHLALVRSGRGSLVHAALYRSAPLRSVRELQEKRSEEEHSCQKRAGLHLTTSELPTDLICSPGMPNTRRSRYKITHSRILTTRIHAVCGNVCVSKLRSGFVRVLCTLTLAG